MRPIFMGFQDKKKDAGTLPELERVWDKLQAFPHIFEVAAARGHSDGLWSQWTTEDNTSHVHNTRDVPSLEGGASGVR